MSDAAVVNRPGVIADVGHVTSLTPTFKLVFLTVLGFTVLSLLINVALVLVLMEANDEVMRLIETCATITKTGFGAIVGLIGGKAI